MKITVTKYGLFPETADGGTKGSYGVENMEFSFSPEWEGLSKSITFYPPRSAAKCVYLDADSIPLPYEVTSRAGKTAYVICGSATGREMITLTGTIEVCDTLLPTENEAADYTPSAIAVITGACEAAAQSAADAHKSAQQAEQIREDCAGYADSAAGSAEEARAGLDGKMDRQIVDTLPRDGADPLKVYMVPSRDGGYDLYQYTERQAQTTDVYYRWIIIVEGGNTSGPAYVFTERQEPVLGDAVYYASDGGWEDPTALDLFDSVTDYTDGIMTAGPARYRYPQKVMLTLQTASASSGWRKLLTDADAENSDWEDISDEMVSAQTGSYAKELGGNYKELGVWITISGDTSGNAAAGKIDLSVSAQTGKTVVFRDPAAWLPASEQTKRIFYRIQMCGSTAVGERLFSQDEPECGISPASAESQTISKTLGVDIGRAYTDAIALNFTEDAYPLPAGSRITVRGIRA